MNNDHVGIPNFSGELQQHANSPVKQYSAATERTDVQPDTAAQHTAQPKPLQDDTAVVQQPAGAVQRDEDSLLSDDEFTLSVGDIRLQLQSLGISKSKDTIQRYCRDGALEWRKLGVFKRYFVTDRSVKKLIEKLQHDAGAEIGTQVHAGANEEKTDDVQLQDAAPNEITNNDNELHTAAPSSMRQHAGAEEKNETEMPVHAAANSLVLEDEPLVKELRKTIERMEEGTEFLQDELRDRRQQTKALSAVIDAFKANAETANLKALTEHAQQEAADIKNDTTHFTTSVFEQGGEGDNQQNNLAGSGV